MSMLSFTIQSPDSRIQSHGTWFNEGSENSKTSPGTRSWEETERPIFEIKDQRDVHYHGYFKVDLQNPFLRTRTSQSKREISLRRRMVCTLGQSLELESRGMTTYRSGLQHGCCNAGNRDKKDAHGVVVIFIHGPKQKAGHLEHVERMKGLVEVGVRNRNIFANWPTCRDFVPRQPRAVEQSFAEYQ